MSEKSKNFVLCAFCLIAFIHLLSDISRFWFDKKNRAMQSAADERNGEYYKKLAELAKEELDENRLRDYLNCSLGSSVCDRLYPEPAKKMKDARENSNTETEK